MTNKPKIKGTLAESAVVGFLRTQGWPHAERLALQGKLDKGDVTGTPGIVWEVKSVALTNWGKWLREAEIEKANANAVFGIAVLKPAGIGMTRVGLWWAGMQSGSFRALRHAAGVLPDEVFQARVSGANITEGLPKAMRLLNDPILTEGKKFGTVEITPRGVESGDLRYTITTLRQMSTLLRLVGYGEKVDTDV